MQERIMPEEGYLQGGYQASSAASQWSKVEAVSKALTAGAAHWHYSSQLVFGLGGMLWPTKSGHNMDFTSLWAERSICRVDGSGWGCRHSNPSFPPGKRGKHIRLPLSLSHILFVSALEPMSCRKKTCVCGKCWVHIWGQDGGMCHSVMVLSFSISLFPRLWQKFRHTRKGNERTLDLTTTKNLAEPFKMESFMKGDQINDTEVHRVFKYTWMYFSIGTIWPDQVRGSHTSSVRIK